MKEEYRKVTIKIIKTIRSKKRLKQLYTIACCMYEREKKEKEQENDKEIL